MNLSIDKLPNLLKDGIAVLGLWVAFVGGFFENDHKWEILALTAVLALVYLHSRHLSKLMTLANEREKACAKQVNALTQSVAALYGAVLKLASGKRAKLELPPLNDLLNGKVTIKLDEGV